MKISDVTAEMVTYEVMLSRFVIFIKVHVIQCPTFEQ